MAFECITRCIQKPIQWKYIHSTGFECIISDMELGQMKGIIQISSKAITNALRIW